MLCNKKTKLNLAIVLIAMGLGLGAVVQAAPIGTAFTYRGELYDANHVAEGAYDFQLRLYDGPNVIDGNQVGSDVNKADVNVVDGYFTMELDFGSAVFDGNAVWLEVSVRPGHVNDPNAYTSLYPRENVTAVPYSLQTRGIFVDDVGNIGIGTTDPTGPLQIGTWPTPEEPDIRPFVVTEQGKVGIGTIDPLGPLQIGTWPTPEDPDIRPFVVTEQGKVGIGTTDPTGPLQIGTWPTPEEPDIRPFVVTGQGKVGIGTTDPTGPLQIGTWPTPEEPDIRPFVVTGQGKVGIGTTDPTGPLQIGTWPTPEEPDIRPFVVTGQGKVGIGTTDPTGPLQIGTWPTPEEPDIRPFVVTEQGKVGIGTTDPLGPLQIGTWPTPEEPDNLPVVVTRTGRVGIGLTNPTARLTVDGAILRGGSTMHGSGAYTHINLGHLSTTGEPGENKFGATVAGGYQNRAAGNYTAIGGGSDNITGSYYTTVGGGKGNDANGPYATVSGGFFNEASGDRSTVVGGQLNSANGDYSFAAGRQAKANHRGSFVWADSTSVDVSSPANNTFTVCAGGGVWFGTTSTPSMPAGRFINTSTDAYLSVGGSWTDSSSRNKKEDILSVDVREVLEKLVQVPISTWNYKAEAPSIRHMGPMAQDLYAAFGLGDSDECIATIDSGGISMAAIQGLYGLLEEKDCEIVALKKQNERLEARLSVIEALLIEYGTRREGGQQ